MKEEKNLSPTVLEDGTENNLNPSDIYPISRVTYQVSGKFLESGETPSGESITVPDANLSLRDILDRHTRGTLPQGDGLYLDELDIPNFAAMDLVERKEWRDWNNDRLTELESEFKKAQALRNHDEHHSRNNPEPDEVGKPQKRDGQDDSEGMVDS